MTIRVHACDEQQYADLLAQGLNSAPGHVMSTWMDTLATKMGDPNTQWLIISGIGQATTKCAASCSQTSAVTNHIRWPDGTSGLDGGRDHEPEMLDFWQSHPLP